MNVDLRKVSKVWKIAFVLIAVWNGIALIILSTNFVSKIVLIPMLSISLGAVIFVGTMIIYQGLQRSEIILKDNGKHQ